MSNIYFGVEEWYKMQIVVSPENNSARKELICDDEQWTECDQRSLAQGL